MTSAPETVPCFAKINLFLEIRDKRPDGYHNLGTLFQTVDCGDRLSAEPAETLCLDGAEGITATPDDNLVIKAAKLLRASFPDRVKADQGMRFSLAKILPTGAGLGGGSSNCAAALQLCNRIWGMGLSEADLLPVAARLGADVPFFLYGGCYFGEGKGEILSPAPDPYPFHVVIGTPECRVETGWAYGQLDPGAQAGMGPLQGALLHLLRGLGVLPGAPQRLRRAHAPALPPNRRPGRSHGRVQARQNPAQRQRLQRVQPLPGTPGSRKLPSRNQSPMPVFRLGCLYGLAV